MIHTKKPNNNIHFWYRIIAIAYSKDYTQVEYNHIPIRLCMNVTDQKNLTEFKLHPLYMWVFLMVIAVLSIGIRWYGLSTFYTIDEAYHWITRIRLFGEAIEQGHWAATNLTGHPGVTTMWLGSIGEDLAHQRGVYDLGGAGTGAEFLSYLRLPLAITNGLTVVLAYLILRKLARPSIALLSTIFWACSPFLVGLGRLLHLDGLLTSFMALSTLLLLHAVLANKSINRLALMGSGIAAGLAFLTKAPSIFLVPYTALILFLFYQNNTTQQINNRKSFLAHITDQLLRIVPWFCLWLGCGIITIFVIWPAMWTTPVAALGRVYREIVVNGGSPEPAGNFFMGQALGEPGPLFYLVSLGLRTTPWVLIGLLLCWLTLRNHHTTPNQNLLTWLSGRYSREQQTIIALLLFVFFFGLMMTIQPKKFDRYLLPIWPSLQILAAAGLVSFVELIKQRFTSTQKILNSSASIYLGPILALVIAVQPNMQYKGYELSYYNPLLGGGAVAQKTILVGLGEAQNLVGDWLSQRPDLIRGPVLSWIPPTLGPFVPNPPGVSDLRVDLLNKPSSYAVLYSRSVQRKESAEAEAYVRQNPPLHTVELFGITYATIHQLPRPFQTANEATFGDDELLLRGFSQEQQGDTLIITPSWSVLADQPSQRLCFIHIIGPDGQRVAQIDALIDQGMFSEWQAGQHFDTPFPLHFPTNLPSGEYQVVLGVYTPEGQRLVVQQGPIAAEHLAGANAIILTNIQVP